MTPTEYEPTVIERQGIRIQKGSFKVSGDGIFATRQGEGVTAGLNAVFFRLQHCNLSCGRDAGWQCDTGYTWDRRSREFWQEPYDLSYDQAAAQIEHAWSSTFPNDPDKRVVVTGGEPLIQQDGIIRLHQELSGWRMEIETNGTIKPKPELSDAQFNCSPKLESSGNSLRRRYRPDVLGAINQLPRSTFKFVAVSLSDLGEVDQIIRECGISGGKVLIMPEGQSAEEVARKASILAEEIHNHGWSMTQRNQLIWYGPKRRT